MANDNPSPSTRFKKGQSGNPNGRPKGKKNKYSNARLAEELAKGDATALNTILALMQNDEENGATRLRAATAWVGFSLEMRKRIADEVNKNKEKDKKEKEDDTPILSFKAVDGGKS